MSKLVTIDNLKTFLAQCDGRYQRSFVIDGSNNITVDEVVNDNNLTSNWVIRDNIIDDNLGTSGDFNIISTPVNTPEDGRPVISVPTNLIGGVKSDELQGTLPLTTFDGSSYTSIKLSNLPGLTSTKRMFNDCKKLTNLNLVGLDTSNVTDMSNMISGCKNLAKVSINTLNTTSTESMANMFEGDTALESIDLTSFDLRKVTDLSGMFRGCTNLKEIIFGNGFKNMSTPNRENAIVSFGDLGATIDCRGMFSGCEAIETIDLSYIDPCVILVDGTEVLELKNLVFNKFINGLKDQNGNSIADTYEIFYNNYMLNIGMHDMFEGCTNLKNITTDKNNTPYFKFGHTPWQITNNETGQSKSIFTICDLSSCKQLTEDTIRNLFELDRYENYDNTNKSLFGVILDDDVFGKARDLLGQPNNLNNAGIYTKGYIIIPKGYYTSSQTSLASEITVDDGQDA